MSLRRISRRWETLARTDPFWAVLSDPAMRGNRWKREECFRTGRVEIEEVLAYVAGRGLELRRREALDFGCGVGRLTQALADHFASDVVPFPGGHLLQVGRRRAFAEVERMLRQLEII